MSIDDLSEAFTGLSTVTAVSSNNSVTPPASSSSADHHSPFSHPAVRVRPTLEIKIIPQAALIETKTRAKSREFDYAECFPQLYLSQTPMLYLARHYRGTFERVQKTGLESVLLASYEKKTKAQLGKVKTLLEQISREARKMGTGVPLSLICQKGRLTLHRRDALAARLLGEEDAKRFG